MVQHRLFGLRGKAYVKEMKRIMAEDGEAIAQSWHRRVRENGQFSAKDLGALANEFRLPLTVLDDYLPELVGHSQDLTYRAGTWERLKSAGVKAKDIGVVWE